MQKFYRKVIRIVAEDSPNVAFALEQRARGIEPDGRILVPGVLTWQDYQKRLAFWDDVKKQVSLWAKFYEGPELKLFPQQWLTRALGMPVPSGIIRRARGIGIDTALGGDNTAMVAVDEMGVIEIQTGKTRDTSVIPQRAVKFMEKWQCAPENVCFDAGGGGHEACDYIRRIYGIECRAIRFGESLTLEPIRHKRSFGEKVEIKGERYAYFNRRAQLYGEASMLFDPSGVGQALLPGLKAFALPPMYCGRELTPGQMSLTFQLSKMPREYDEEGRLKLPPKTRPQNEKDTGQKKRYLTDIIGHSPDEADAFVLAVHGMLHRKKVMVAGGG